MSKQSDGKENGDYIEGDTRVIYSGGERAERGVAILTKGMVRGAVEKYECISDRLIWIKLKGEKVDTIVIHVYMSTNESPEEEIDEMYDTIEEVLDTVTNDNDHHGRLERYCGRRSRRE